MPLTKPFEILALRLQESAGDMSHADIRARVGKAVQDAAPNGGYAYVHDVFGDDESGDVVHSTNGKMLRSPYTISDGTASVGDGTPVMARTVYDEEPDEDDRMAAMQEAALYSEGPTPIVERFVSKDERAAAGAEDFAGKGKSFPILKPEDVAAAARSLGRAGSGNNAPSTIKARIIAIAKHKGWGKYLPKAWQDGETKESVAADITEFIALRESSVAQDGTTLLKLMAPGWSANGNHYSEAMLKRDGPKVFRSGTKNYWNHQTAAEAAARPEGNLDDLAGVLTEDAHWESKGPAGAGLYAKATVYEHYRKPVDTMAKHIGVSIRALAERRIGTIEGRKGNIIEKMTHGQSVDYVTEPSAGGEIVSLFEAARPHQQQREEIDMDQAQVTALVESAVNAKVAPLITENAGLKQELARFKAISVCETVLNGIKLHEAAAQRTKKRITEGAIPLTEAGALDEAKLKPLIESIAAEEQAYAAQFIPTGVRGMGAHVAPTVDEQKVFEADQARTTSNIHALAGIQKKKEAA